MTTRRNFLGGVAGAFVAAVVGVKPKSALAYHNGLHVKFAAVDTANTAAAIKPLPAWSVGDGGEMNWKVIFAETEEEAIKEWWEEEHSASADDPCACGKDDCGGTLFNCKHSQEEWHYHHPDRVDRSPNFDNPLNATPSNGELFDAGWCTYCDRCDTEVCRDWEGGFVIDGKPVCEECATIEEIRAIDPEHWRVENEEEDEEDGDTDQV